MYEHPVFFSDNFAPGKSDLKMELSVERSGMLRGAMLVVLFACTATLIGGMSWVKALSLSPLVVGIILGMVYANTLRARSPENWTFGISFCSKRILRAGIVLYGFRLSFQDVAAVGLPAVAVDAIVVAGTIGLGLLVGRLLNMDRETALLTSCGSAICGAAAVMGVDGVIRPQPYKTAVAVSTVVIFGTLSMFLYPVLFRTGVLGLDSAQMGMMSGATIHEVAHVVGAGNAIGPEASNTAIIVKMIRVMMLVPVLLVIALMFSRRAGAAEGRKGKITVPWFALLFLAVIAFNSLGLLPSGVVSMINTADTFLLTMAMTALGMDTSFDKFRKAGAKPFLLASVLFVWLVVVGYLLVRYLVPVLS